MIECDFLREYRLDLMTVVTTQSMDDFLRLLLGLKSNSRFMEWYSAKDKPTTRTAAAAPPPGTKTVSSTQGSAAVFAALNDTYQPRKRKRKR